MWDQRFDHILAGHPVLDNLDGEISDEGRIRSFEA